MLVDAAAALVFGHLYDKVGVKALMISTLLSSVFAVFVFSIHSIPMLLLGVPSGESGWALRNLS